MRRGLENRRRAKRSQNNGRKIGTVEWQKCPVPLNLNLVTGVRVMALHVTAGHRAGSTGSSGMAASCRASHVAGWLGRRIQRVEIARLDCQKDNQGKEYEPFSQSHLPNRLLPPPWS